MSKLSEFNRWLEKHNLFNPPTSIDDIQYLDRQSLVEFGKPMKNVFNLSIVKLNSSYQVSVNVNK